MFTEFSFLFSGLQSFLSRSQVYRVFLLVFRFTVFLLVLRFTEFSFLFLGLQSFPFCSQVYRVFLFVLRFTEFSFSTLTYHSLFFSSPHLSSSYKTTYGLLLHIVLHKRFRNLFFFGCKIYFNSSSVIHLGQRLIIISLKYFFFDF